MSNDPPSVIVLTGPNGAGKTTSSRSLLADTLGVVRYVNADTIAQGLAGFAPETAALEAGRIMHRRLRELAERKVDFAFETTLAARSYGPWLAELRQNGFEVKLFYFLLPSADMAVARVAARVQAGGHDVPESIIRQRYPKSVRNFFKIYQSLADAWSVYDNSIEETTRLVACGVCGDVSTIVDMIAWDQMLRTAIND